MRDLFGERADRRPGRADEEGDGLVERLRGMAAGAALGQQHLGEAHPGVGALGDGSKYVDGGRRLAASSRCWRCPRGVPLRLAQGEEGSVPDGAPVERPLRRCCE